MLCTALSLISAFRVIRDITERKKSILKAPHRQMAGEELEEVTMKREQLTFLKCMHVIHVHVHVHGSVSLVSLAYFYSLHQSFQCVLTGTYACTYIHVCSLA